jgi:hypothetical protein
LLVTTVIALSVTVVMLYRELGPLRNDVARLRSEVGELNIEDRTKLHVIRVDTDNELEWKWRIWIPEGRRFRLRAIGGSIPKEGYPTSGGTVDLSESGEHVIRYVIRRDPRDGSWRGSVHTQTASVGSDEHPWVEWPSSVSTGGGVSTSTQSFPDGEKVEIIRRRVSQAKSSANIENPAAGFMVWLEPN